MREMKSTVTANLDAQGHVARQSSRSPEVCGGSGVLRSWSRSAVSIMGISGGNDCLVGRSGRSDNAVNMDNEMDNSEDGVSYVD